MIGCRAWWSWLRGNGALLVLAAFKVLVNGRPEAQPTDTNEDRIRTFPGCFRNKKVTGDKRSLLRCVIKQADKHHHNRYRHSKQAHHSRVYLLPTSVSSPLGTPPPIMPSISRQNVMIGFLCRPRTISSRADAPACSVATAKIVQARVLIIVGWWLGVEKYSEVFATRGRGQYHAHPQYQYLLCAGDRNDWLALLTEISPSRAGRGCFIAKRRVSSRR